MVGKHVPGLIDWLTLYGTCKLRHPFLPTLCLALFFIAAPSAAAKADEDDPFKGLVRFPAPWSSPFRIDPQYPHHFVNEEGEHLFLLNKTAWLFFGCDDPEGVLKKARSLGVNVLRVALEGRLYFEQVGVDLWPWGGSREKPDWRSFNEEYWQTVERRIRMAGEYGIGFDLVLYTTLKPSDDQTNLHRPYWERAISQLGKYANVFCWEIANEYIANEKFQDAAGEFFKKHDRFGRPVCTSTGTTDDAVWPHKPWVDLAINHLCTSSTAAHDLRDWYLAVARNMRSHGKPAFCNESGREKRHRNDDGVHRRKQAWLWCTAGCFWTWHSWDGCEGINNPGYRAPGEEFLKPLADFYRSLPFWQLAPNYTALVVDGQDLVSTALATPERDIVVCYLCTRKTDQELVAVRAQVRLPAGQYEVQFVEPSSGRPLASRRFIAKSLAERATLELPPFRDDLVILVRCKARGSQGPIPGTE